MSSIQNREQELLLFLSKMSDYVTAETIALNLKTSKKTVYRLVKKVNEGFDEGLLISSEKGRGYKLDSENFIKSQKNGLKSATTGISPEDRQKRVTENLLLLSPKWIKIHELYENYYVGDTAIFNDEQIISCNLKNFNLSLERSNRSLRVLGEENDIRRAIKETSDIFNIIDIDELKQNNHLNFNNYDILFVADQIRLIEKKLKTTIAYPYNINIFSHMYILIHRTKNNLVKKDEDEPSNFDNVYVDTTMYELVQLIIKNTEIFLHMPLPEVEIYFMYQYLVSSRVQNLDIEDSIFNKEVVDVTNFYIQSMEMLLDIKVDSTSIFNDLANHIKPMLNRLRHDIKIKNSLLYQIDNNYKEIFEYIREVSTLVSKKYNLPSINDNENSFLTLYFAKIVELHKKNKKINALIVCTTGIGTSELLRVKVERLFPELNILGVTSSKKIRNFTDEDIDLIISTVDLDKLSEKRYLLVSAMFTKDDQKRLSSRIEDLHYGK